MKHRFTILFFFVFTSIFAESYTVVSALNIRSSESKTSQIVGKLEKNAIIEGTDLGNGWIKLDNEKGFVNSVYVQKIENTKQEKSFWNIYKDSYFIICVIIAVIFSVLYASFNTKKDKRYKEGHNKKEWEIKNTFGMIIGAIISLPISLIVTLFYTMYKYFF